MKGRSMGERNGPRARRKTAWPNLLVAGLAGLLLGACETTDGGDFGAVLGDVLASQGVGTESTSGLTTLEIERGLREALTVGTERVADQLGQTDGYFADPSIKIPLPGRLGGLQSTLGRVGLSAPLDDLELKLNRAAEAAIPDGKRLVIAAVNQITLEDAVGILQGADDAATLYLREKTETGLRDALTPYMNDALTSSGAFSALETVASNNGLSGLSSSLKADLTSTAVDKGLDGLFLYLASEEQKIRDNPVARTSEILRKVFG